jgi:hypothetical protein
MHNIYINVGICKSLAGPTAAEPTVTTNATESGFDYPILMSLAGLLIILCCNCNWACVDN